MKEVKAISPQSMVAYLGLWGLFSIFLFIATVKASRALLVVFGLVVEYSYF